MHLAIDPGHGGDDPGCVANGLIEKTLALELSLRLRDMLPRGAVSLTREGDTHPSLATRGAFTAANKADVVLCVHANATTSPEPNYLAVFTLFDDAAATQVAQAILDAAPHELAPRRKPLPVSHQGDWSRCFNVLHPHLGRHPVLIECGFLTNPDAAAFLKTEAGKQRVVAALLAGANTVGILFSEESHGTSTAC